MVLVCRDAMLIAVMDVVTSLIAGFVIFTTFGGMAKKIGVEVKDVAKSGKIMLPTCICLRSSLQKNFEMAITYCSSVDLFAGYGLAFVAYPEALSQLPVSQLWAVLFFFMLFTLGLDSEVKKSSHQLNIPFRQYSRIKNYL